MLCSNCGKEIPENTRFCNYCGADQTVKTGQGSSFSEVEPPKREKPKKKKNILLVLVAVLAASSIGQIAGRKFAQSGAEDKKPDSVVLDNSIDEKKKTEDKIPELKEIEKPEIETETETETEPKAESVPAEAASYEQIFRDRNIVQSPQLFMMQDSAAFAKVDDEGTVECLEWGYKDDMIATLVRTLYVDITDLPESEKEAADSLVRAEIPAQWDGLDFVSIESNTGTSIYRISVKVEKLDEADILKQAIETGLIEATGEGEFLSMSETEKMLLEEGYLKK